MFPCEPCKQLPDKSEIGVEAIGNEKALVLLKQASPADWRHSHLNGRYISRH